MAKEKAATNAAVYAVALDVSRKPGRRIGRPHQTQGPLSWGPAETHQKSRRPWYDGRGGTGICPHGTTQHGNQWPSPHSGAGHMLVIDDRRTRWGLTAPGAAAFSYALERKEIPGWDARRMRGR